MGLATAASRPQAAAGEGSRRQAGRTATRTALLPRRLAAVPHLLPRPALSVAPSRRALALPARAQQEQQQQQPPLPNLPPDTLPADFAVRRTLRIVAPLRACAPLASLAQ